MSQQHLISRNLCWWRTSWRSGPSVRCFSRQLRFSSAKTHLR